MFWNKKKEDPKTLIELFACRTELEKKLSLLNEQILKFQIACDHPSYITMNKSDGHGYQVCIDCCAELMRVY